MKLLLFLSFFIIPVYAMENTKNLELLPRILLDPEHVELQLETSTLSRALLLRKYGISNLNDYLQPKQSFIFKLDNLPISLSHIKPVGMSLSPTGTEIIVAALLTTHRKNDTALILRLAKDRLPLNQPAEIFLELKHFEQPCHIIGEETINEIGLRLSKNNNNLKIALTSNKDNGVVKTHHYELSPHTSRALLKKSEIYRIIKEDLNNN